MLNASQSCKKTFSSLDDYEELYEREGRWAKSCQLARVLGRVSEVVLHGFLYRLILAVELGVFFLLLRNFVMPFVLAAYFV